MEKAMDAQTTIHQIANNNAYCLCMQCKKDTTLIKLTIKLSKYKEDLYQIALSSLKDVKKLQDNFKGVKDFRQYIRDPANVEVLLDRKIINIVKKIQNGKIVKITQIASLQLTFLKSFEVIPEEKLINNILYQCSLKNNLGTNIIRGFFEGIAIQLSEIQIQRKVRRQQLDLSEKRIHALEFKVQRLMVQLEQKSKQIQKKQIENKKSIQELKQIQLLSVKKIKSLDGEIQRLKVEIQKKQTLQKLQNQNVKQQLKKIINNMKQNSKQLTQETNKKCELSQKRIIALEIEMKKIKVELEQKSKELQKKQILIQQNKKNILKLQQNYCLSDKNIYNLDSEIKQLMAQLQIFKQQKAISYRLMSQFIKTTTEIKQSIQQQAQKAITKVQYQFSQKRINSLEKEMKKIRVKLELEQGQQQIQKQQILNQTFLGLNRSHDFMGTNQITSKKYYK